MQWNDCIDNPWSTGWYSVGDKRYPDKLSAMMAATQEKSYMSWDFHNDLFKKVNWTQSPDKPLKQLYKERAQALRDRYDHLVLYYSGGADSHNILQSFINNDIRLDEVYTTAAISATEDWFVANPLDTRSQNALAEYNLVVKPVLEKLRITNPEIKITVDDWTVNLVDRLSHIDEKEFITIGTQFINMGAMLRLANINLSHNHQLEAGKSSACIMGIDKPKLCFKDNKAYMYFLDLLADAYGSRKYKNVELFYWSPDAIELLQKQCQTLLNFFQVNPNLTYLLEITRRKTSEEITFINSLFNSILYPDWDTGTFQANKPTKMFYTEVDDWVRYKFGSTGVVQNWESAVRNLLKVIDPKFINWDQGHAIGFVGCVSPMYYLGEFQPKILY